MSPHPFRPIAFCNAGRHLQVDGVDQNKGGSSSQHWAGQRWPSPNFSCEQVDRRWRGKRQSRVWRVPTAPFPLALPTRGRAGLGTVESNTTVIGLSFLERFPHSIFQRCRFWLVSAALHSMRKRSGRSLCGCYHAAGRSRARLAPRRKTRRGWNGRSPPAWTGGPAAIRNGPSPGVRTLGPFVPPGAIGDSGDLIK